LNPDELRALDKETMLAQDMWKVLHEGIADRKEVADRGEPVTVYVRDARVLLVPGGELPDLGLAFPAGHPIEGLLYVGHPAIPALYYPAAQFHRLTFEHKFAEAVRLLRALGATRMQVEHVKGLATEWLSNPGAGVLGLHGEGQTTSAARILYQAELKRVAEPGLPSDLVSYSGEPLWQEIAESRLVGQLKNFELFVSYEDDFHVSAQVVFGIANDGSGISAGGRFEEHEATVSRIVGEF
jgi:hypothetical protein